MMLLRKNLSARARKIVLLLVVLASILFVAGFGWYILQELAAWDSDLTPDANQPELAVQEPLPVALEASWLFTGNSFWGRYTNDAAQKTDNPHAFPFSRLNEFKRDKYDAWVTGLECPTTVKGTTMTSADMEATLTFNCDPAYLGEFSKWFDAVSLANNHTDNMGADGFAETQTALAKNGIQYFGHYNPEQKTDLCEVVSLPTRVTMSDGNVEKRSLAVALCGYHYVFAIPSAESVAVIAQYAKYFPTIVLPHGGAEYEAAPDQIKTDLYHAMIDAGADMVLGDHPHWIQSTEAYNGKLIAYSMGNFMFDQQGSSELTRSAAIQVDVGAHDIDSELFELADQCATYHDKCLDIAEQKDLKKQQLEYHFDAIATADVGYKAYPAPELQTGVEQRLRWSDTMLALGQD